MTAHNSIISPVNPHKLAEFGIGIGHTSHPMLGTGMTVITAARGASAGVDVRGGGPATRETDLLAAHNLVEKVHAIVLSGGSAFGLACVQGVVEKLEQIGIGLNVGPTVVPIVPAACLFDLNFIQHEVRPTPQDGAAATMQALNNPDYLSQGNVGAGTGATVGKVLGPAWATKGGLGIAGMQSGELYAFAVCACNALGDIIDPTTNEIVAGIQLTNPHAISNSRDALLHTTLASDGKMPLSGTNTTISCVITNATLTKAQCTKVAQIAHDAYARCINPTHTTNDGDTIFCLATGDLPFKAGHVDAAGVLCETALEQAIMNAVRHAEPLNNPQAAAAPKS